jgi:hypothetical protein
VTAVTRLGAVVGAVIGAEGAATQAAAKKRGIDTMRNARMESSGMQVRLFDAGQRRKLQIKIPTHELRDFTRVSRKRVKLTRIEVFRL